MKFLPYSEASRLTREAGIKTVTEYRVWEKPDGVPSSPNITYKGSGWVCWGDFLGNGSRKRIRRVQSEEYFPYGEAMRAAREAGIDSFDAYRAWKTRPVGVPSNPNIAYAGKGWESWGAFLGTGYRQGRPPEDFLPYAEAARLTREAGIASMDAYHAWKKPGGVPARPERVYARKGWISWTSLFRKENPFSPIVFAPRIGRRVGKFVEMWHTKDTRRKRFVSYEEAVRLVRAAGIPSYRAYLKWKRSAGMPWNPADIYKGKGWISWGVFLGTGRGPRTTSENRVPYEEAVRLVRAAGITSVAAFLNWERPVDFPSTPHLSYVDKGWVSWGEFFGTGWKRTRSVDRLSYEEAARLTQASGIKTNREFEDWKARPDGVPAKPALTYGSLGVWKDWGHFLGTNRKRWECKTYVSYEEAVRLVREAGIPTSTAFHKWTRPEGVPSQPADIYKGKGWVSWGVFLGTGSKNNELRRADSVAATLAYEI